MIRRTSTWRSVCGPPQHRMKVCYDRYGRFQQIPFGAGVEHLFCFVYASDSLILCALGLHHGFSRHNLDHCVTRVKRCPKNSTSVLI